MPLLFIIKRVLNKVQTVSTFSVIDVFVKIAAHIYRGGSIDLVGNQINILKNESTK